jgi:hypothetical protein
LSFLCGAAASAFASAGGTAADAGFPLWYSGGTAAVGFLSCVLWCAAAILASTSVLGGVLIPAAAFVCGWAAAFQSASIISAGAGIISTKMLFGFFIPAALIVPPFFLTGCDGVFFSRLISARQDQRLRRSAAGRRLAADGVFAMVTALGAAEYIWRLMPRMI